MSCVRSNGALKRCLLTPESLWLIVFTKQRLEQPWVYVASSQQKQNASHSFRANPDMSFLRLLSNEMRSRELTRTQFNSLKASLNSQCFFFSDGQNQFIPKFKRMRLPYLKSVSSMYLYTLLKWMMDAENTRADVSLLRLGLVLAVSIKTLTFQKSCYEPF